MSHRTGTMRLSISSGLCAMLVAAAAVGEVGELVKFIESDDQSQFGTNVTASGGIALVGDFGSAHLVDISDPAVPMMLAKIVPDDDEYPSRFGFWGAIKGNVAYISSHTDDDNGIDAGTVYIFDVSDPANPTQLGKLFPNDPFPHQEFGIPMGVLGDLLLVGYNGARYGIATGALYVFDLTDPTHPHQVAKIVSNDSSFGDSFGMFFGNGDPADSTTALVGAWEDDDQGAKSGSAYLFDLADPTNPAQLVKILPDDGTAGARFGTPCVITGNLAVIGATGARNDDGVDTGAVYLFDITDPAAPQQVSKITPDDGQAGDLFGWLDAAGDLLVVGAPGHGPNYLGAVYFYDISDPSNPTLLAEKIAPVKASLGHRIKMIGDVALVSAPLYARKGAVAVYDAHIHDPCEFDLDGDDVVDAADLGILLNNWGQAGLGNQDVKKTVDGEMLGEMLTAWGSCP